MGPNQKIFLNEDLLDLWPTLAFPSPALTNPLPANIFPNRLAPKKCKKSSFLFFSFILIVSLTPSNNNPESSRDSIFLKYLPLHHLKLLR